MTVHQGPFNSVYAGHAALHAIDTGLILTLSYSLPVSIFLLSGSLPVYSCTIRLTAIILRLAACLVLRYQAHILSLSGLLHVYSHSQACCHLFSHSHSGSLPIYSHSIRLVACLFSHYQLLIYSLALTQACCLSILTPSGSLPILTLTQARSCLILTPPQSRCLSSLLSSGSLPIYSNSHSGSLPVYSHSHSMLAACLFSLSLRLAAYQSQLRLASINSHSSHLSSPTSRYLVSTIRFATYLALSVLPCHSQTHPPPMSSICSYSYPSSHSDLLPTSCTSSYSICALSDSLPSDLALSDLPT